MTYAEIVAARRDAPPPYLGKRFDADRRPLPCPGNTMIGHIRPGPIRDALTAARDRLAAAPAGDCFAWLPPDSYHMTLYDGVLYGRREPGYWPPALAPDAPDAEADAFVFARLGALAPPAPFRMTPVALEPARGAGVWLRLAPETAAEERRIRLFRDACAEAVGLADRPGHADYPFHVTLAYGVAWPDAAAAQTFDAALAEAEATLRLAAPLIEIGPPELCRFADMTRFEPALILR